MTTRLLELTAPDGTIVWVVGKYVTMITPATRELYTPKARTVLSVGSTNQAVCETPEEVVMLIEQMEF